MEVIIDLPVSTHLMRVAGPTIVRARAIAGSEDSTAAAALMVLDPNPPTINVPALPISLPSLTPLLGGLEILGLGAVEVQAQ